MNDYPNMAGINTFRFEQVAVEANALPEGKLTKDALAEIREKFGVASPDYVVAHAKWRESRGKAPSVAYLDIANPTLALQQAQEDLVAVQSLRGELAIAESREFEEYLNKLIISIGSTARVSALDYSYKNKIRIINNSIYDRPLKTLDEISLKNRIPTTPLGDEFILDNPVPSGGLNNPRPGRDYLLDHHFENTDPYDKPFPRPYTLRDEHDPIFPVDSTMFPDDIHAELTPDIPPSKFDYVLPIAPQLFNNREKILPPFLRNHQLKLRHEEQPMPSDHSIMEGHDDPMSRNPHLLRLVGSYQPSRLLMQILAEYEEGDAVAVDDASAEATAVEVVETQE